jgi:secondary thiamine-phosphate synthase enzyme
MQTLVLETERRTQLVDVTARVRDAVRGRAGGAVVIFIPHTTAGIVLQASGEGATAVAADIERALERVVDESWSWEHTGEGDRNPWAHVRSVLTASSITIPLEAGELALGELQTIFFCEFDGPRRRRMHITVT